MRVFGIVAVFSLGVAAGALGAAAVVRSVMSPTAAVDASTAEAVVVLAGSPADRVTEGLRLMEQGAAEVLVLSVGVDAPRGWTQVGDLCDVEHDFTVYCVVPQTNNTIGEAATISRLAEQQGWRSLALVTSRYHLDRATTYFDSCFEGKILPVASEPARITWPLVRHEMLGAVHARTVGQRCPRPDQSTKPRIVASLATASR